MMSNSLCGVQYLAAGYFVRSVVVVCILSGRLDCLRKIFSLIPVILVTLSFIDAWRCSSCLGASLVMRLLAM